MRKRVKGPPVRKSQGALERSKERGSGGPEVGTPVALSPSTGFSRAEGTTIPIQGDVFPLVDRFHPDNCSEAAADGITSVLKDSPLTRKRSAFGEQGGSGSLERPLENVGVGSYSAS